MRRKIPALIPLCVLLLVLPLIGWFFAAEAIVHLQAESAYYRLERFYCNYSSRLDQDSRLWDDPEHQTSGCLDAIGTMFNQPQYVDLDPGLAWAAELGLDVPPYSVWSAVILEGPDWTLESGDYLYFSRYQTQEQWQAQFSQEWRTLYVPLHRDGDDPYAKLYALHTMTGGYMRDVAVMRLTGTIDGQQFLPARIDYVSDAAMRYEDLTELSRQDAQGLVEWENLMQTDAAPEEDTQVIYVRAPQMTVHKPLGVQYRGQVYNSLPELLRNVDFYGRLHEANETTLEQLLVFNQFEITDSHGDPVTVRLVCVSSPLAEARQALSLPLFSAGLAVILVSGLLILLLYRRLVRPVDQCVRFLEDEWNSLLLDQKDTGWKEPHRLQVLLEIADAQREKDKDTIKQLDKALNYAHNAEKNRRQLTSSIAHELKTPLAIIHSYAEGLKENIAEEKREQYLDTILTEAQRMDAMVMELLELSRLEAGKVTLHRQPLQLSQLVESCWEPFVPLAEGKHLQVRLELQPDCRVSADETRLRQAIRNLLSNAVRHTPEGGQVIIRTQLGKKRACFRVENTAAAFSSTDLQKVWDSFYQTDPSRSGKGTGLGLAITKSIITLHGGSCYVRNTNLGVEFRFEL